LFCNEKTHQRRKVTLVFSTGKKKELSMDSYRETLPVGADSEYKWLKPRREKNQIWQI